MEHVSTCLALSFSSQLVSCIISLALCKMSQLLNHRTHKSSMITFGKWAWLIYGHESCCGIGTNDRNSTTQFGTTYKCLYMCYAHLKGHLTFYRFILKWWAIAYPFHEIIRVYIWDWTRDVNVRILIHSVRWTVFFSHTIPLFFFFSSFHSVHCVNPIDWNQSTAWHMRHHPLAHAANERLLFITKGQNDY